MEQRGVISSDSSSKLSKRPLWDVTGADLVQFIHKLQIPFILLLLEMKYLNEIIYQKPYNVTSTRSIDH